MRGAFSRPRARWRSGRSSAIRRTPGLILRRATSIWSRATSTRRSAELTEAIDLNPSFAFAHVILGCAYGYGGMPDDGLHHCDIAARLSPRDFAQAVNFSVRGLCHFIAGRFAEAVEWERRAVEIRPHFGTAWRTLAAAAGKAGKLELAVHALSEAKRLHPSLSLEWVEKYHPIVHERDRAVYIDGLRAAGLE